ncbi:MAG: response regulator [Armatimonadetes bacterium]|nr:response regulator [Armatimonadota bacterium]
MNIPLRILIVEDSEDDTMLLVRELKRGGYDLTYERVDTKEAMSAALDRQTWDVIISDYVMPGFGGLDALKLAKERSLDLPFIVVSGKIGEETAVEAMKAGAHDYIMKDNLARLVPAVERELRDAEVRQERRRAQQELRAREKLLQILVEHAPAAVAMLDSDMRYLAVSRRWLTDYKLGERNIIGLSHYEVFPEILSKQDWLEIHQRCLAGATERREEDSFARADGRVEWVRWEIVPWRKADGSVGGMIMFTEIITERKLAEQRERRLEKHKREFYRRTILAATGGKLLICDRRAVKRVVGDPIVSRQLERPKDLGGIRHALARMAEARGMDEQRIYDFLLCLGEAGTNALKHAGGGTVTVHNSRAESMVVVVSDKGPGIEALVLPEATLRLGYSTAGSLGMGYKAIISLADQVYLATGPGGTTVAVEVKLHKQEALPDVGGIPDTW